MHSDDIIALYERRATTWVQARLRQTVLYESAWLDRFCALIPPRGAILDCGCGAGEPIASHLAGRGHAITGIDSSATMVRLFQARLPAQEALVADMRTLALGRRFHGILAWDSFFHLNHGDQRQMFQTFRAHAAPGAALMFTSGTSHSESLGVLAGETLYHASLDPSEYRALLEEQGFTVIHTVAEDPACEGRTVWLARLQEADPEH